jgi:hypothetical protein
MKREISILSLSMIAFVSHAACAQGLGEEGLLPSYSSGASSYMPHYGPDGSMHPLMEHLAVPGATPERKMGGAWQLELAPPAAAYQSDDPQLAKDKRVGVTFKLGF